VANPNAASGFVSLMRLYIYYMSGNTGVRNSNYWSEHIITI